LTTEDKNKSVIPNAGAMRFGIVVSQWNTTITKALYQAAQKTLLQHGAKKKNIKLIYVPGSFELVLGAHHLAGKKNIDAVICLGCIIKGETPHFDFIAAATANNLALLNIQHHKPVIFGVLTTNNLQQAKDRSGGKHGNKGEEAALTAIKMAALLRK
jgi:6,7-dimethyl-8-ribityllumazine synthase